MKLHHAIALSTAISVSLSGCASIVSSSTKPVSITSTPDGIPFIIKNNHGLSVHSGVTPTSVTLNASQGFFQKASYSIVYQTPNQTEQIRSLTASINGWYFGNILFGGLIGMLIVDPASGAMWKLPELISADMPSPAVPAQTPASEKPLETAAAQ